MKRSFERIPFDFYIFMFRRRLYSLNATLNGDYYVRKSYLWGYYVIKTTFHGGKWSQMRWFYIIIFSECVAATHPNVSYIASISVKHLCSYTFCRYSVTLVFSKAPRTSWKLARLCWKLTAHSSRFPSCLSITVYTSMIRRNPFPW